MSVGGQGKLLRIFVGESDRRHGQPLYAAIVEELRRAGIAGATVFKGIEGYGGHAVVHAARVFDLSTDLPIVIEAVDREERFRAVLPAIKEMAAGSLVTLQDIEIVSERRPRREERT